jgi:hypothetical protein
MHEEAVLSLQARSAARIRGSPQDDRERLHRKLPNDGPDWQMPEMIGVEGELPSQALIRMRRANHI